MYVYCFKFYFNSVDANKFLSIVESSKGVVLMDRKKANLGVGYNGELGHSDLLKSYGIQTLPSCKISCAICKYFKQFESVEGVCKAHNNIVVDQWYWCESDFELAVEPDDDN